MFPDPVLLVLAFPFLGFVLNAILAFRAQTTSHVLAHRVACTSAVLSWMSAVILLIQGWDTPARDVVIGDWLQSGTYHIPIAFYVDRLSMTMALLVTSV